MPDEKKDPLTSSEEPIPAVYASPLKRVWAWVGVAYMLVIVCLITYSLAFGAYLHGIGGLLVCPALGGTTASLVVLWRQEKRHSSLQLALFLGTLGLCTALIVLSLRSGIPGLVNNFGVR
jgi:hypothetical protein